MVVKNRSPIPSFFLQPLIPQFLVSEYPYNGKRYNYSYLHLLSRQKYTSINTLGPMPRLIA